MNSSQGRKASTKPPSVLLPPVRTGIVCTDLLFKEHFSRIFASFEEIELIGSVEPNSALDFCAKSEPEVLVVEVWQEKDKFSDLAQNLMEASPVQLLCVPRTSDFKEVEIAFISGAGAIMMPDDPPELLRVAVSAVNQGVFMLSPTAWRMIREELKNRRADRPQLAGLPLRIAGLVGHGLSNEEIAEKLHLSTSTVRTYMTTIMKESGCNSRAQLAAKAHFWCWVDAQPKETCCTDSA